MGAFGGLILTNKGRNLQAKAQTGVQLNFTKIKIGDGSLSGQSIVDLTDLISTKKELTILGLQTLAGGKAKLRSYFSNTDIITGFYWRELGVFAQDPQEGEILYCYGNAGANAEYIPAGGGPDIVERYINVITLIGNASNISATLGSEIYVTQADFESHASRHASGGADPLAPADIGAETPNGAQAKVDAHGGAIQTHGASGSYYLAKTSRTDQLPAWADIPDKPSSFTPSAHKTTHATGGADALAPADIGAASAADLAAHLADKVHIPYAVASGSANAYSVTVSGVTTYQEGLAIAVKINVDNTGASTINVNGLGAISIKKPNGNDVSAGNLKAGSIYTLRYNGTNFILQGEGGSGTAQPADVLSGKTFTNDAGEQIGTMPNRGAYNITPGTSNIIIPQGYHNGSGIVYGDPNLIAANIKTGVSIFGVTGILTKQLRLYQTPSEVFKIGCNINVTGSMSSSADYVSLDVTNGVTGYVGLDADTSLATINSVDLTGLSQLKITWELTCDNSSFNSYLYAYFIVSTSQTDGINVYTARTSVSRPFARRTDTLNAAGLSGQYYIRVHIYKASGIAGGATVSLKIYEITGT